MAISWGAWKYSSSGGLTNGMRAGIEATLSGTTITVKYYVQNHAQYYDSQKSTRSGAITGSTTYQNNGGGGAVIHIATLSTTGSRGSSYTFGHSISEAYDGVTPSHSVSVSIPIVAPNAPTAVTATRVNDGQVNIGITHGSSGGGNPITTTVIQRRWASESSWFPVGSVAGAATSFSDTTLAANEGWVYRVRAENSAGQSAWVESSAVYTTPAPVTSVTATRVGNNISVGAAGLPPFATSYTIQASQNGGAWANLQTGVTSFPWTHTAPNPAVTWRYRVISVRGGLSSAASSQSNLVQLQAPPNAPTGLSPNGGVIATDASAITFSWTHNPVDSSLQTQRQLRRRIGTGTWVEFSSTANAGQSVTLSAAQVQSGVGTSAGEWQWSVRTKGAHPDWSPWSSPATFTFVTPPTVAISSPSGVGDHGQPELTVAWNYSQAESRPQSSWEMQLLDADNNALETRSGSGATSSVALLTRLETGRSYTVRVRVATGPAWSNWAAQSFTTLFVPPAIPEVSCSWSEELGLHIVQAEAGARSVTNGPTNYAPTIKGAPKTEVRRNWIIAPNAESGSNAGWENFSNTSYSSSTEQPREGTRSFKVIGTASVSGIIQSINGAVIGSATDMPAGDATFSIWVKAPAGMAMRFIVQEYQKSTLTSRGQLTELFTATGDWQRMHGVYTVTAADSFCRVGAQVMEPTGGTFYVTDAMAEPGTVLRPYFDGNTPNTRMDEHVWTGAENASESVKLSNAVEVYRNLFTNPNLVGDGTWAEVRRNLFKNPTPTNPAYWPGARMNISFHSDPGGDYVRGVVNAVGGSYFQSTSAIPKISVEEGKSYTFSAEARTSGGWDVSIRIYWFDGSNTVIGSHVPGESTNSSEWGSRISVTGVAPPGAVFGGTYIIASSAAPVGAVLDVRKYVAEETPVAGGFFDGDTPDRTVDPDMRQRWLGTPNASESVMEIERVAGLTAVNCVAGVSTREGKPAMRLIPTGASSLSYAWSAIPVEARTSGTALGTLYLDEPLTGSLNTDALSIRVHTPTQRESAPNTAGEHPLRLGFSGITSGNTLRLYHGGAQDSGDVWWTDIGLFAGDYDGPAFSGDTTPSDVAGQITQPEDFRWRWVGAPNASESVMEIETVAGVSAGACFAGVSTWEGKPAIRQIANTPSNVGIAWIPIPIPARAQGVFMATSNITAPLTNVLNPQRLRARAVNPAQYDATVSTPPNEAGSYPQRAKYSSLASDYRAEMIHGGAQGSGDVWWTDIGLFDGDYDGPWFDGDSGVVESNGLQYFAVWNPDGTSSLVAIPETVGGTVQRSVDNGVTWEDVLTDQTPLPLNLNDFEGLSCGQTMYRVLAYAASGASTPGYCWTLAESDAIWINGGPGFSVGARLPGSPSIKHSAGRRRAVEEYEGRELPVAYSSRRLLNSTSFGGRIVDGEEGFSDSNDLLKVVEQLEAVHVYRDMHGKREYGSLSLLSLSRVGQRRDNCTGECPHGIWDYSLGLSRTERN